MPEGQERARSQPVEKQLPKVKQRVDDLAGQARDSLRRNGLNPEVVGIDVNKSLNPEDILQKKEQAK